MFCRRVKHSTQEFGFIILSRSEGSHVLEGQEIAVAQNDKQLIAVESGYASAFVRVRPRPSLAAARQLGHPSTAAAAQPNRQRDVLAQLASQHLGHQERRAAKHAHLQAALDAGGLLIR